MQQVIQTEFSKNRSKEEIANALLLEKKSKLKRNFLESKTVFNIDLFGFKEFKTLKDLIHFVYKNFGKLEIIKESQVLKDLVKKHSSFGKYVVTLGFNLFLFSRLDELTYPDGTINYSQLVLFCTWFLSFIPPVYFRVKSQEIQGLSANIKLICEIIEIENYLNLPENKRLINNC